MEHTHQICGQAKTANTVVSNQDNVAPREHLAMSEGGLGLLQLGDGGAAGLSG